MQLSIYLSGFGFDPGDKHPVLLKVNCINSVEKSAALEINFSWYRLVCANGMKYGIGESNFRKIHLKSVDSKEIAAYVSKSA